jgi:competence protein ComGC|tara:strand:+ start:550 stop:1242 length:693 start_codon:yes stop_codon:yes gene_type:complete
VISTIHRAGRFNRNAAAYTMIEMMVAMTVVVMMASILLGAIGRQGSSAEKKIIYIQNRDTLVAMANHHNWNYLNPIDPNAGRMISELEFDGSVREHDLFYLWEIIQPHFPHRKKMNELTLLSFNDTEFADRWMTNLIGIDKTGYPYRTEGLKTLLLENTQISDVGLKMLYVHMPKLQPQAPKIQQEEASKYAMTNLTEISVHGCKNVTKRGIADLQRAFPNLKIISTFNP